MNVFRESFASTHLSRDEKRKVLGWVGFAVLFLVVWYPGLDVGFRNDHWWFLREIRDLPNDLWALIKATYSYPRTRTVLPVGYLEFRPLTHIVISADQYFFGTNGRLWMVHSLAVHLFTVLALFWLLRPYCSFWLSLVSVAVFSVGVDALELVTWSHMHGYNWFILFVLLAFGFWDRGRRLKTFIALTLCCFLVELGVAICVVLLAAVIMGAKRAQWQSWLVPLTLPMAIFFALNVIDYASHFGWVLPPGDGTARAEGVSEIVGVAYTSIKMMYNYSILTVLPWFLRVDLSGWPFHARYDYGLFHSRPELFDQIFLGLIVLVSLLWIGQRMVGKISDGQPNARRDLGISLIVSAMAFIFVIALGRSDADYLLHQRLHYSYLWAALFIPGAVLLLCPVIHVANRRIGIAAIGLIVLLQGGTTLEKCLEYRNRARPLVEYYGAIQKFVDQRQLGDFQLVLPKPKDVPDLERLNYTLARRDGKIVLVEPFTLTSLVFHKYLAPKAVKYRIEVPANGTPIFTLLK